MVKIVARKTHLQFKNVALMLILSSLLVCVGCYKIHHVEDGEGIAETNMSVCMCINSFNFNFISALYEYLSI